MERTTNSADARRAADYLSRYCNENGTDVCKGCFAREDSGFCILCESSPNNWELPSIWSAQDIALAKAMMPFAKLSSGLLRRNLIRITAILRARDSAPFRYRQGLLIICVPARLSI